jgi:hypothetical protein
MSRNGWWCTVVLALVLGLLPARRAQAQHAGFVLFPDAPQLTLFPDLLAKEKASDAKDQDLFVHPLTGPYFHEDSFVTSDARLWYAYQTVDKASVVGGGEGQVVAAQLRLAITDQIQLVAYKDGYTMLNTGAIDKDGWNDIAAGLKWNFLQDWKDQMHAAVGVGYQFPWGESRVLQNKEELRMWTSFDKGFGPLHLGATFNYFFATGEQGPAGAGDHLSAHAHVDYWMCKYFSPVVEANFYEVTNSRNAVLPIQGSDLTNLGGDVNENILTLGIGAEFRPMKNVGLRAAWEHNVAHPTMGIFDSRLTLSAVLSF